MSLKKYMVAEKCACSWHIVLNSWRGLSAMSLFVFLSVLLYVCLS